MCTHTCTTYIDVSVRLCVFVLCRIVCAYAYVVCVYVCVCVCMCVCVAHGTIATPDAQSCPPCMRPGLPSACPVCGLPLAHPVCNLPRTLCAMPALHATCHRSSLGVCTCPERLQLPSTTHLPCTLYHTCRRLCLVMCNGLKGSSREGTLRAEMGRCGEGALGVEGLRQRWGSVEKGLSEEALAWLACACEFCG